MRKLVVALLFLLPTEIFAQSNLWQEVKEDAVATDAVPALTHKTGRVLRLDQTMLSDLLNGAPMEFTPAARATQLVVTIPMPDRSFQRFRVEESPMLSREVAAQVPDWKSYSGRGIDDPTAVVRFSWSKAGFSAMVVGASGTSYIETASKTDREHYIVYRREDLKSDARAFHCELDEYLTKQGKGPAAPRAEQAGGAVPNFTTAATLKTYRLAVAANGEYTVDRGGQDAALVDVMNAVNRFNLVFRRDAGVSFTLVSGTNTIFPDPETDPYDNTPQLEVNQTQLDNIIGSANYDIGHLFGTGGGGLASSPSVCSSFKAQGYSARKPPTGDPFWVDYVAHEIGHQLGAQHTYNTSEATTCSTRSAGSAYEVASGSTIMSYVGICGERNLQQFSIDMFHVRSLTEMLAQIVANPGGAQCGTDTATGNTPPTPNAGANFNIPKQTPFILTASATDPNAGDALTYSWEQYDLAPSASGPNGTPAGTFDVDSDGVQRPLFRAYAPVINPTRMYPSLPYVLANANIPPQTFSGTSPTGAVCATGSTCVTGETLPAIARTLNFRVVVRDNNGGTADAGMQVNVSESGPFAITAPNGGGTLSGAQTVTWSVNGTDAAPVSAANVRITLSTDGGQSFPITLAASAPNNGSAAVTLPTNISTTTARVRIEAIGNIFFDVSDSNFTVVASETCVAVTQVSPKTGTTGDTVTITGVNFTNGGNVTGVKFSNNVAATFAVVNDTTLTATVPAGAVSGPLTISKTGCPDAQSPSFTVCPNAPVELKVDDGTLESRSGSPSNGVSYVNRLTPTSYPATLTSVLIFWDPFLDFAPGSPITVLAGTNASGSATITGTTFQSFAATAGTSGFSTYTLPNPITITAGDFVVGYSVPTGPSAVAVDTNAPASRSYFGSGFVVVTDGNYMIRAQIFTDCNVAPTTVQFSAPSTSVSEGAGAVPLVLTRSGDTSGSTTVNVSTGGGTAQPGTDYTPTSGPVTFGPGETSKTVTVPVLNDPADEPNESFVATIAPTPAPKAEGGSTSGAPAVTTEETVTIVDDDGIELTEVRARSVSLSGSNVTIGFDGVIAGRTYQLERKLSLTDATWEFPVANANDFVANDAGSGQIIHTGGASEQKAFYRVRLQDSAFPVMPRAGSQRIRGQAK